MHARPAGTLSYSHKCHIPSLTHTGSSPLPTPGRERCLFDRRARPRCSSALPTGPSQQFQGQADQGVTQGGCFFVCTPGNLGLLILYLHDHIHNAFAVKSHLPSYINHTHSLAGPAARMSCWPKSDDDVRRGESGLFQCLLFMMIRLQLPCILLVIRLQLPASYS